MPPQPVKNLAFPTTDKLPSFTDMVVAHSSVAVPVEETVPLFTFIAVALIAVVGLDTVPPFTLTVPLSNVIAGPKPLVLSIVPVILITPEPLIKTKLLLCPR